MTAANIFLLPDRACLLTDTGKYNDAGEMLATGRKVASSERHRVAIATAGIGYLGMDADLARWMDEQPSQAALLQRLADRGRALNSELSELSAEPDSHHRAMPLQMFVALWHAQRDQPETYIMGAPGSEFGPSYTPWTLAGVAEVISPRADRSLYPHPGFDPRRDGLRLIEAQRAYKDERGAHRVGGQAELTEVTRDGINQSVLRVWPDKLGQMIKPEVSRLRRLLDRKKRGP